MPSSQRSLREIWNRWGDPARGPALPPNAASLLNGLLGTPTPPREATLDAVLASVPRSRLPAHPLVVTARVDRLLHAAGQGFPDLVAVRCGRIPAFPDGVAYPGSDADVRALLQYAAAVGARVIAYGGGTSVVGHVNPQPGPHPVLTVDLRRLSRLVDLDETDRLATFGAGVAGPDLEAQLAVHGYTLGHFPQSFERSTLGGWIATRSCGQQSLGYGRIERLFAGGRVETPRGTLRLPSFPATAAGPDLREMVLGSEGRLGILTEAVVRIAPRPRHEDFHAVFFGEWGRALAAVRAITQRQLPLSLLRLSTPGETAITLGMGVRSRLVDGIRALTTRGRPASGFCMLLIGVSGERSTTRFARRAALEAVREHGGLYVGRAFGDRWHRSRFRAPYLRDRLWELGYGVDTVETAVSWSGVPGMIYAIERALLTALQRRDERVHAFTHLSHVYPQGSSVYTTFVFRTHPDPDETLERWRALKRSASHAIVTHGGTISHQHGIGTDHREYLEMEKGPLGIESITRLLGTFDPAGMLNPGKLV